MNTPFTPRQHQGTVLLDRRAAATLAAAQAWVAAREERRALGREKRAAEQTWKDDGGSLFSKARARIDEMERALPAARKRERQALEAVAKACGVMPRRRAITADAREVADLRALEA